MIGRRSTDDEKNIDALSFIEYKSVRFGQGLKKFVEETGKVYQDSENWYPLNVNHTHVIISHLESGVKYRLVLKALNRNTDSLTVTRETFTGD